MKTLYIIHPGVIISKNDGKNHYLSIQQLKELYRLRDKPCTTFRKFKKGYRPGGFRPKHTPIVHCHPKYDGDYTLCL